MGPFTISITLDDAYKCFHTAVGLPETADGKDRAQFFLRLAVILGWLAAEESAKDDMRIWIRKGYAGTNPHNLTDKICLSEALRKFIRKALTVLQQVDRDADENELTRKALSQQPEIDKYFAVSKSMFDLAEFKRERLIRSDVTHSNTSRMLTLSEAKGCLAYCSKLIEMSSGYPVIRNPEKLRL